MEKVILGRIGLKVSKMCVGTLTVGPLQNNYDIDRSAEIFAYAIKNGVNFFDTAQLYKTYRHLKAGIKLSGYSDVIIASKTYAYTKQQAQQALDEARRALDRDIIDIFLLHEQESIHTANGHMAAFEFFMEQKAKGTVKAVGLSTHHISGVEAAIMLDVDVIHPIFNKKSLGIVDGDSRQMAEMIMRAHKQKIGVYSMKALGGGNLFSKAEECLNYVLDSDFIDSIAIGCSSIEEVEANINFFKTRSFTPQQSKDIACRSRKLIIEDHCSACGNCAKACGQSAISVTDNAAIVDRDKCVLCGYCSAKCEHFCIKII